MAWDILSIPLQKKMVCNRMKTFMLYILRNHNGSGGGGGRGEVVGARVRSD